MLERSLFAGTRLRCATLFAASLFAGAAAAQVPQYDHVVLVMMENHSFTEIIGSASAPYINTIASQGATFTQSFGIEHPSQPNYLDIFSGANQGTTGTDACVASLVNADNLGNQLRTASFTFVGYSESLPSAGSTTCVTADSLYARKHNPWSDFANLGDLATAAVVNQPFSAFPADFSTLPTVAFVAPNQCHDMHGIGGTCPAGTAAIITDGDTWLSTTSGIADYAAWATQHNSLLIITWDEDDSSSSNRIATIFYGANVVPGLYSETINHYSVLATLEAMYGLPALAGAATKTPITDVFRVFADGFE